VKTAILSSHDYEPYGSALPYRGFEASKTEDKYKFGFNSQEMDFDIIEGLYGAEFWEYDSRTGRRWNVDPVVYASISGYSCFLGNPIYFVDPSGASAVGAWLKKAVTNIKKVAKNILTVGQDIAKNGVKISGELIDEAVCTAKRPSWLKRAVKNIMWNLKEIGQGFAQLGSDLLESTGFNFIKNLTFKKGSTSYHNSDKSVIRESDADELYSESDEAEGGSVGAEKHNGQLTNIDKNPLIGTMGAPREGLPESSVDISPLTKYAKQLYSEISTIVNNSVDAIDATFKKTSSDVNVEVKKSSQPINGTVNQAGNIEIKDKNGMTAVKPNGDTVYTAKKDKKGNLIIDSVYAEHKE